MIAIGFVIAAGAGAVLRWRTAATIGRLQGTMLVNLLGSFVLGVLVGQSESTTTIVGVALLGSLTTWSTFIAEVVVVARADRSQAVRYLVISLVGGIAAAWLGLQLG